MIAVSFCAGDGVDVIPASLMRNRYELPLALCKIGKMYDVRKTSVSPDPAYGIQVPSLPMQIRT